MNKLGIILAAVFILYIGYLLIQNFLFSPTEQLGIVQNENIESSTEFIFSNLDIPWEIAFLPNDEILITQRPGTILKMGPNETLIEIEGVAHRGEGGLLGIAIHPKFEENNWIYLYLTSNSSDGLINRVERYELVGNSLKNKIIIIDKIPGASYHDGGRIAFGPDNFLYITTGDAGNEYLAQDRDSLAGKILRLNDDGSIPEGNEFNSPVYSYGHRNPQGLVWDDSGQLWATEHGRSGARSGFDELNKIVSGGNYGWPDSQGDEVAEGTIGPVIHSGPDITWAPAGAAYYKGSIFFAGLRGESLYEAIISNGEVESFKTHFHQEYGRLRAVVLGPDNFLYISTSNTDGRGDLREGDDKIIKIKPNNF